MSKIFFNIIESKKDGEFFISHPDNGAKGTVEKSTSKAGNGILVVRLEVGGKVLKGILNKTSPEKLKEAAASGKKLPTIWGELKDESGGEFATAGWWTTVKKNGERCKANYFSCSVEEKKPSVHEEEHSDGYEPCDVPF